VLQNQKNKLLTINIIAESSSIFKLIINNFNNEFEITHFKTSMDKHCNALLEQGNVDIVMLHYPLIENKMSDCIESLRQASKATKILIFGSNVEDNVLHKMLRCGVNGYVDEAVKRDDLIKAVEQIMLGRLWVERHILEEFAYRSFELESIIESIIKSKVKQLGDALTPRETQVLQLVLNGLATREIADTLHLSEQSVKLHLGRMFKKFEVTNRSQLILLAFERVCPISNMIRLFRTGIDKKRVAQGKKTLITDPLSVEESHV